MALDPTLEKSMLAMVPRLRAFAIALCRHRDQADDLVQETLLRAVANIHLFEPGTNLFAWLVTILRNQFRSECRKRHRNVEDADGKYAETLRTPPDQDHNLTFDDRREALDKLSVEHREALICIAMSGLSYEQAANICQCPVGTVKSRMNRARARLAKLLAIESADDLGPTRAMRAVLQPDPRRATAASVFH
jgi:RNA polymerase sigma-70 factor (ECF subfamily)